METNIWEWISEMSTRIRENRNRGVFYVVFTLYLSVWYGLTSRWPTGRNVYEEDWDLLVILDACRVDTLCEVADEYEFIDNADGVWSVGSQSCEWLANTFTEAYRQDVEETTYISGNGYSESVLSRHQYPPANNTTPLDFASWSVVDESTLAGHEEVWKSHHDETYGSVLPEPMTDHTIEEFRSGTSDRVIAHYTQPHLPYVGAAYREGKSGTDVEMRGYELLETGQAEHEEVYEAYKETLRWVLDDVEELLENVDAEKVVITSDHGEAFGEWKAYGHPEGFPHPAVRKVPWVETTATDEHTREPDLSASSSVETDIEDHLRDLGYR